MTLKVFTNIVNEHIPNKTFTNIRAAFRLALKIEVRGK